MFCRSSELPADDVFDVAGDVNESREKEESDDGGEEDPEGKRGRHWLEELSL